MSRWELSTQGMTTEQAFGRYYEGYTQMLKKQGIKGDELKAKQAAYSKALQQKLKFEPQNLQVGREIAQNPAAYGITNPNNVTAELNNAQKQLKIMTQDLGNGATSTTYFGTPQQLRDAAPLGDVTQSSNLNRSARDIQAQQRALYNAENPSKVTYSKIKNGANKGKWGVFVDGKLKSVYNSKTQASKARQAIANGLKPAAQPAAQPTQTASQQPFTRGDRVRANNLWTTRVRPELTSEFSTNPLTQSVLPDRDFRGRNFINDANQAAASHQAAQSTAQAAQSTAQATQSTAQPAVQTIQIGQNKTKPSRADRLKEIRNNPAKRARYNRLKLAQNPELKTRYESMKNFKKMKGLKKAGKWGALAALAIGATALIYKSCNSDDKTSAADAKQFEKPAAPVNENPQETDKPIETNPTTPVGPAPAEPSEEAPAAPAQPAPVDETPAADVLENIIQNADTLEQVANRYGITVEQLKELNADKIKQFHTADGRVIEGFRVGEDITLPEETKKVEGLKSKDEAIADYEEYLVKNFDNIPKSMWNQVCTPEFRRKHKLGEYKEAA